jgi:hypothetical protein
MAERDPPSERLIYDRLIKRSLLRFYPDFATWVLGERPLEVKDIDPIVPAVIQREGDKFLDVRRREGPGLLLHLEFQIEDRAGVRRKMMQFAALALDLLATEEHRGKEFSGVVVYLDEKTYHGDPGEFIMEGPFGFLLAIRYKVLRLWEMDPEAVLGMKAPGLWPFAALMRGKPEELLVQSKNKILGAPEAEVPFEEKKVLLAMLAAFAGRRLPSRKVFLGFIEEVRRMGENILFDMLIEEGIEKGIEKGNRKGLTAALLKVLARRFGAEAQELSGQLGAIEDPAELERLIEEAAVAPTLDAFRMAMDSPPADPS